MTCPQQLGQAGGTRQADSMQPKGAQQQPSRPSCLRFHARILADSASGDSSAIWRPSALPPMGKILREGVTIVCPAANPRMRPAIQLISTTTDDRVSLLRGRF